MRRNTGVSQSVGTHRTTYPLVAIGDAAFPGDTELRQSSKPSIEKTGRPAAAASPPRLTGIRRINRTTCQYLWRNSS